MSRSEWKEKYIARLYCRGLDYGLALSVYNACRGEHDYDDDPIEAADNELSYWGD